MPSPIAHTAIQALAAYGAPQRAAAVQGEAQFAVARDTVRRAPGVTVELSAEARATLIAVQSAAFAPEAVAMRASPAAAGPIERPGSRVNLSI